MYSPLVAPGGLVAFHDISPDPAEWTQGVARFWQEFTAEHETKECVVSGEPGFGIPSTVCPFTDAILGLLRLPDSLVSVHR